MKGMHHKQKGSAVIYDDIFILEGARTPFGKLCGTLSRVSPTDLGIYAAKGALEKSGVNPDEVDHLVAANIGQSSTDAYFLPRHIALYSGLPQTTPAVMVQRICGSGFETAVVGADYISLGKADTVLCVGTENMSLAPSVSFGNRMGYSLGRVVFQDMLWEALNDTAAVPMGNTAENVAKVYNVSREEADTFAKLSNDRYVEAKSRGYFTDEIIPVKSGCFEVEGLHPRKVSISSKESEFVTDENVRQSELDSMQKLPSVFTRDGVQTAANSSGIVDGAAAVVIAGKGFLQSKKIKPLTKVAAITTSALNPHMMGLGPVYAIQYLLEITGLKTDDIGLFEINEAFAAQFIGCEKELRLDRAKCNINGGAIAIGHPLAATGLRLMHTLSRQMKQNNVKYGIASACIGGGQGTAVLLELAD